MVKTINFAFPDIINWCKMMRYGLFYLLSVFIMFLPLLSSCSSEKNAEKVASSFLKAYYVDMDYEKAKEMAISNSHDEIDSRAEISAMNPYAKEELPSVQFKEVRFDESDPDKAICLYTLNRAEKELLMRKVSGKWLVEITGASVESSSSIQGGYSLSTGTETGFASAASGPVVYKKRKR